MLQKFPYLLQDEEILEEKLLNLQDKNFHFFLPFLTAKERMDGKVFERCFIWLICKKAEELPEPKNESDLANAAFVGIDHPVNAWRSVRNGTKGKFRSLGMDEAYNLAIAVNSSLPELCWDVMNHLRNGWTMAQDVSLKKGMPGRPGSNKKTTKAQKLMAEQREIIAANTENT